MFIPLFVQKFLLNLLLKKVFGPNRLQMEADVDSVSGAVKAFKAVVAQPIIPFIPPLITKELPTAKTIAKETVKKELADIQESVAGSVKSLVPAVKSVVPRSK